MYIFLSIYQSNYLYVYIYIYTMYVYVCVSVCVRVSLCMFINVPTNVRTFTYAHKKVCRNTLSDTYFIG